MKRAKPDGDFQRLRHQLQIRLCDFLPSAVNQPDLPAPAPQIAVHEGYVCSAGGGVRPAVVIGLGDCVLAGDGTRTNPYRIECLTPNDWEGGYSVAWLAAAASSVGAA